MEATELEERFVQHLRDVSKDVEWRYERWLEDNDRECDENAYCPECVEIQRRVEKRNKTGFTHISGWDEWFTKDNTPFCDRCGCVLYHSLTEYGLEQEVEHFTSQPGPIVGVDASILAHALDCGGEYCDSTRAKYWPRLEPIAKRELGVS